MLKVSNVTYSYKKNHPVLQNVNFALPDGIAFLIGENGSGKSTLLKAVSYTHLDVYKRQVVRLRVY